MAKAKASTKALDFSNVKERSNVSPTHRPEGDYLGTVVSVEDIKMGPEKRDAWLFIFKVGAGTYAYRCGFNENELWKIRNLFVAAGVAVPKKRQAIDPNKPVGKKIGLTLQDHEYEGKMSSEVSSVFPPSDLDPGADSVDDEEVDAAEDVDEETEEPKAAKKKDKGKKAKPAPEPEKPAKKGKKNKKMDSLDIDDL